MYHQKMSGMCPADASVAVDPLLREEPDDEEEEEDDDEDEDEDDGNSGGYSE